LRRGRVYTLHITQIDLRGRTWLIERRFLRSKPDDAELRLAGASHCPDFDITFCAMYRRDPFPRSPFLGPPWKP
jgi:hypothetical protein